MHTFQKEPFRLLFPAAAVLGWVGVLPWFLFGTGLRPGWPGLQHATTMVQAFLGAVAIGFLGTMLPRRTATPPMGRFELLWFVALLAAIAAGAAAGWLPVAEVANLLLLLSLVRFALARLAAARARGRTVAGNPPSRPMPPSFVFLPAALLAGTAGALLLVGFSAGHFTWMLAPGRSLAGEGLFEGLVLALAPMLASPILHDGKDGERVHSPRGRALWAAAALVFLASFVLQHAVAERLGHALRGALAAGLLLGAVRPWRMPGASGLHRRLFPVALAMVPLGLLLAAAQPALRLGALHLTFIGGLSLLVFSVSFHVVLLHTGRSLLAASRPWPVAVVAALTIIAALLRTGAEQWGPRYFLALALASSMWLAAAAVWGGWLVWLLARLPDAEAGRA